MSEELRLQQRVMDELAFEPALNAAHIGVAVCEGIVTLSGHVETYAEKHAAERAARRVKGVRAIAQEIEVHLAPDKKTADDEIAARAVKLLSWDVALPVDVIRVKVDHGIVTLSGEVDWAYQRAEAGYDMRKLGGVKAVINDIRIKPHAKASDVRAEIHGALERAADVDADAITVEVRDGKVFLGGKVRSWIEREEAERAAWSVPGVTAVEDNIAISRP